MSYKRFQVALSFPGEHRDYVSQLAIQLAESLGHDAILYDAWYKAEFTRPNLDTYLQDLYHNHSLLIVPFLCADYKNKDWCQLEWRAIRDLIKQREDDDIMPMRFDNTHVPGVFDIDGYLDLRKYEPKEAAELILQRLRVNKLARGSPVYNEIKKENSPIKNISQPNKSPRASKGVYIFYLSIFFLIVIANYQAAVELDDTLSPDERLSLLVLVLLTNFVVIYAVFLIFKYIYNYFRKKNDQP